MMRNFLLNLLPRWWGLTAFNAVLVAVAVYLLAGYYVHTRLFFNRELPLVDRPNVTAVGYQAPAPIDEIAFTFRPNERALALYVVFNYTRFEDNYEALCFSVHPDLPAGLTLVRRGLPRFVPLVQPPRAGEQRVTIRRAHDTVVVTVNGRTVLETAELPLGTVVDFAFDPAYPLAAARPPQTTLDHLSIRTIAGQDRQWSHAVRTGVIAAAVLGAVWLLLTADWLLSVLLFGVLGNRRTAVRLRAVYLSLPLLFLLARLAAPLVWQADKLQREPCGWFGPAIRSGRFDLDKFLAQSAIENHCDSGVKRWFFDPRVPELRVLAFGGSSTEGTPYGNRYWSWPAQLQRCLDQRPEFGDQLTKVYNFGIPGSRLADQVPLVAEPFFATMRPQVVILDTLINDFHYTSAPTVVAQLLGYRVGAHDDRRLERERWLTHYGQVIDMLHRHGALVIVTVPAFDLRYFGANPMQEWQDRLRALVTEKGARLAETGAWLAEADDPFVYWEFIHPTRVGYRRIAEQLCWMLVTQRDVLAAASLDDRATAAQIAGEKP